MNAPEGMVRVFEPADATELAVVRSALEAAGIRFFVENENYFSVAGGGDRGASAGRADGARAPRPGSAVGRHSELLAEAHEWELEQLLDLLEMAPRDAWVRTCYQPYSHSGNADARAGMMGSDSAAEFGV